MRLVGCQGLQFHTKAQLGEDWLPGSLCGCEQDLFPRGLLGSEPQHLAGGQRPPSVPYSIRPLHRAALHRAAGFPQNKQVSKNEIVQKRVPKREATVFS